jgi:hypothetical protein
MASGNVPSKPPPKPGQVSDEQLQAFSETHKQPDEGLRGFADCASGSLPPSALSSTA